MTSTYHIQKAKRDYTHEFFMEILYIADWEIWKQLYANIFRATPPSFQS
jgi:hypothetical protein